MVVEVGNFYVGRQWQGLVRRAHTIEVIHLTIGRVLPVELGAIPRCRAFGAVVTRILDRKVGLTQHGVGVGFVITGMHGRRRVGDLRDIDIPPRRAIFVRAVDVQARLGTHHIIAALRRRLARRTADQQQPHGRTTDQFHRCSRKHSAHYLAPRA
ncbi:hypothetical protein D3C72_1777580 [compost metagenome]